MNRPYIFCHMEVSLDGKIMGNYMDTLEGEKAGEVFEKIAFGNNPYYKHQGWLSGRTTTDDNFTFYKKPKLNMDIVEIPKGDYINNNKAGMYYVSIDPSGKLCWGNNALNYGNNSAHIIEVLTEKASVQYKGFLRNLGISYVIVGKDKIDYALLLDKLYSIFSIKLLMLGGGAILNWSFIQAGYCDEVSLVVAPVADGSNATQSLFLTKEGLSNDKPVGFDLIDVKKEDGGVLWLRYKVKNKGGNNIYE